MDSDCLGGYFNRPNSNAKDRSTGAVWTRLMDRYLLGSVDEYGQPACPAKGLGHEPGYKSIQVFPLLRWICFTSMLPGTRVPR
jgi:hypothetical protein